MKKAKYQWHPIPGMPLTEVDKKVMYWEKKADWFPHENSLNCGSPSLFGKRSHCC